MSWWKRLIMVASIFLLFTSFIILGDILLFEKLDNLNDEKDYWLLNKQLPCIYTDYILTTFDEPYHIDIYGSLYNINITLVLELQTFALINNSSFCLDTTQLLWFEPFVSYDKNTTWLLQEVETKYPKNIPFNCTINRQCSKMGPPIDSKDINRQISIFTAIEYFSFILIIFMVWLFLFCLFLINRQRKNEQYEEIV